MRSRHLNLPDAGAIPHPDLDVRPPALLQRIRSGKITTATNTIAFLALPPGFSRWRLQVLARSTAAAEGDAFTVRFNSDTGANYDYLRMTPGANAGIAQTSLAICICEGANARANTAGWSDVDFYDPSGSTFEKVGRFVSARMGDRSGSVDFLYHHGTWAWRSALPIVQITLTMAAGDFAAGSQAALWGVRHA